MIQHVRVARPTADLKRLVAFYRDVLGLDVIADFKDHDGFDGIMLGQRGAGMHLEFTQERGAKPLPLPTPEHLLVLYFEEADWAAIHQRLRAADVNPVVSHNPYWDQRGITVEDPDGYRIVLHRGAWLAR